MSSERQAYKDGFDNGFSKAKDRIAQLEAENTELLEALNLANDTTIRWIEKYARLREALSPLANAKRVHWHNADSSSDPFVVTEHSVRRAKKALENAT
jgi:hypothetical protein